MIEEARERYKHIHIITNPGGAAMGELRVAAQHGAHTCGRGPPTLAHQRLTPDVVLLLLLNRAAAGTMRNNINAACLSAAWQRPAPTVPLTAQTCCWCRQAFWSAVAAACCMISGRCCLHACGRLCVFRGAISPQKPDAATRVSREWSCSAVGRADNCCEQQ